MRRGTLGCLVLAGVLASGVACDADTPTSGAQAEPGDTAGPGNTAASGNTAAPGTTVEIGGREAISVRIMGGPDWLVADDHNVYVKRDSGQVEVLEPATAAVVASVEVGGDLCQGLGDAGGTLWTCSGTDLVRIDPTSGSLLATVSVGKAHQQGELSTGFGKVWVLVGDGSSLVGIDLVTNLPGEPIALPVRGTDIAVGPDRVWVVSAPDNAVVEVDPEGAVVVRRIDGLIGARMAIEVPAGLWVAGSTASYRIDPATGTVLVTVEGGVGSDGAIATADGQSVWIRKGGVTLNNLDAETGELLEEMSADIGSGGDMVLAFDAIWLTAYDDNILLRIPLD